MILIQITRLDWRLSRGPSGRSAPRESFTAKPQRQANSDDGNALFYLGD